VNRGCKVSVAKKLCEYKLMKGVFLPFVLKEFSE